MQIRKKDKVVIITGKDKGHEGEVLEVLTAVDTPNNKKPARVIVEGANFVKRHMKPRQQGMPGSIVTKEAPLDASNVMLICPKCKKGVRVGHQILENGTKVRVCRKCGTTID